MSRSLVALVMLLVMSVAGCASQSTESSDQVPTQLPTNMGEVDALRVKLTDIVWGDSGKPTSEGVTVSAMLPADLGLLAPVAPLASRVELLTVPLRFSLVSRVVLFTPVIHNKNRCATLYHSGHGPNTTDGIPAIERSLQLGCITAVLEMPQSGRNAGQVAVLADGTRIQLDDNQLHNNLASLDQPERSALDLFLSPVAAVVDYLTSQRNAGPVNMVGFSGGGWTTSLAAALLPRISHSISVAGFLNVTGLSTCAGDYEQCRPQLYGSVSAEQIYVLAAVGEGRVHVQLFNARDSCCYRVSEPPAYAAAVKESVAAVGSGAYIVLIDDTLDVHGIPAAAVNTLADWITAAR